MNATQESIELLAEVNKEIIRCLSIFLSDPLDLDSRQRLSERLDKAYKKCVDAKNNINR